MPTTDSTLIVGEEYIHNRNGGGSRQIVILYVETRNNSFENPPIITFSTNGVTPCRHRIDARLDRIEVVENRAAEMAEFIVLKRDETYWWNFTRGVVTKYDSEGFPAENSACQTGRVMFGRKELNRMMDNLLREGKKKS